MLDKKTFVFGKSEIFLAVVASVLIRWSVALGGYSGQNKPPMYGDYEAQRHWQEITFNLPVTEWYTNSSQNDLLYWGLDYPPLTAYHSWICGYIASKINSSWIELRSSRGVESYDHKLFMRYTVLVIDLLIFFPAVLLLWYESFSAITKERNKNFIFLLFFLFYPGLILIDHGHFQYNNFSLGLFLWAIVAFTKNMYIIGSICFCLTLNYKQMELYHALPIFFFLLGKAFSQDAFKCLTMIAKLALTVIGCFSLLWAPYLCNFESTIQVLHRLFPVGRGLYEDKVANFWCTVSPILKLRSLLPQQRLIQMCAVTTLLLSLPACFHLLVNPKLRNLKFSLVNVSLTFFLFSYQVHEKSILIPAISSCLLFGEVPSLLITWFLYFTVVSMGPLLMKDQLIMQMFASSILFLVLVLTFDFDLKRETKVWKLIRSTFWTSVCLGGVLVSVPFVVNPPIRFPDLWPVLNSSMSCAAFLLFYVAFHYLQFFESPKAIDKKIKKS